jgi:hypothetical protein
MRLNIVGVGPQRTGTTWLYECLREHPQLCFPRDVKETSFFDERFNRGWPWYWSHFQHRRDRQLCAEVAATYFDVPEAAQRIRDHNPRCRVIISLRDPVARCFSLYLHHRKRGRLNGSFRDAIERMPRLIDSSRYRAHVSRWRDYFGADQISIVLLDDISSCPETVLDQTYQFIGIDKAPVPDKAREQINVASLPASRALAALATHGAHWFRDRRLYGPIELAKKLGLKRIYSGFQRPLPALDSEMRRHLVEELSPDIAYVEEILGRALPHWRSSQARFPGEFESQVRS